MQCQSAATGGYGIEVQSFVEENEEFFLVHEDTSPKTGAFRESSSQP